MRTGPTYTTTAFTREELQELALTGGVRERIRQLEVQVRRLQHAFPQVFVSQEPIVLLAPEPRTDGKTWPLVKPTRKPWSAAAKQRQSKRIKDASAFWKKTRRKQAREKKATAKANSQVRTPFWREMHAALLAAPDHCATAKDIRQATGRTDKAVAVAIANAAQQHDDLFKRVKPGVYTLTAAGKNGAAATP